MATYQGSGIGTASVKAPSVGGAINDFDPVLERAAGYADLLHQLCDRVCGPHPEGVAESAKNVPPSSLIGSINERRSRLVDILDSIERSLNQLDPSL